MVPTLSLILTQKERKFGGFSKAEWVDQNGNKILKDYDAFIFSLDNKKKYDILKPEYAIACFPYYNCVIYGNNYDSQGFYIVDQYLTNKSYENHSTKVYNVSSNYCLSGEESFYVKELEVFQIIFE